MLTPSPQLTLFSEVHRASPSPLPESAADSMMTDTFGLKCTALFEHLGRDLSFLKMLRVALAQDCSTLFAVTWKLRGTTRSRWYIQLAYSVRPTNDTECLLLAFWPTPSFSDTRERAPSPSPITTKNGTMRHLNKAGEQSQMRLSQVVKLWATLKASDAKHITMSPSEAFRDSLVSNIMNLGNRSNYLNPAWCELMMGLPMGWTDLTFPASRPTWAGRSMPTSRRARLKRNKPTTRRELRRSVTAWSGSRRTRR